MHARVLAVPVLLATCAMAQLGCAASVAPRGWLADAQNTQQAACGGWLDMKVDVGGAARNVSGELLAVSDDSVFTLRGTAVTASPLTAVQRATLGAYDPGSGGVARMTVAGTLLTVTHGWGLIGTAPLWVIVGTTSSSVLSFQGKYRVDSPVRRDEVTGATTTDPARASWRDLRLYARFPQGIPPGLDRTLLHERPPTKRPKPVRAKPNLNSISGG